MTSWLTAALQNVRQTSADALEFVRKDLTEFTTTVKSDAETYLTNIKPPEVPDLSLDRLMKGWTNPAQSDNADEKNLHASASFDRFQKELTRIQHDETTFLTDPNPVEPYETWRQTSEFNVETRKGDIAQLLIDAPHVRAFYARLVPAQTTHADFWARYYFRLHQIEEEEARRTQLIKRAREICAENNDKNDQNGDNDWDEPEDEWQQNPPVIVEEPKVVEVSEKKEEPLPIDEPSEEPIHERKTSETDLETHQPTILSSSEDEENHSPDSGEGWEGEFDGTEISPTKNEPQSSSIAMESEQLPSIPVAVTTMEAAPTKVSEAKKKDNESDDDWEAWS